MTATIDDVVTRYKAGDLTLEQASAEMSEVPFVETESHADSAWDFDGGSVLDDSFSLLADAFRDHGLTHDEYRTFAKALRSKTVAAKAVFSRRLPPGHAGGGSAASVAAHLPGQHDQASHGRGGGGSPTPAGGGESWEDKYGNDRPQGDGDCFDAAANVMLEAPASEKDRYTLVHGVPEGQGDIEGIRFDHAWVEREEPNLPIKTVIDKSNGNDLELPDVLYYKIGKIDKADVKRYTYEEMTEKMVSTRTYGPWD